MTDRIRSLGPLEGIVDDALEFQQNHFDSLDTKSGMVLGFAGLVVAVSADSSLGQLDSPTLAVIASVTASLSALTALSSFWPREFQVLGVARARNDALGAMEDDDLRVALLDTRISITQANRALLHRKARRLKLSVSIGNCGPCSGHRYPARCYWR